MSKEDNTQISFKQDTDLIYAVLNFADGTIWTTESTLVRNHQKRTYTFFLQPSKRTNEKLNLDNIHEERLTENGNYRFTIPEDWLVSLDDDQKFQTWFVLSDWKLNFLNPFLDFQAKLIHKLKNVQTERDSFFEAMGGMSRRIGKLSTLPVQERRKMMLGLKEESKLFKISMGLGGDDDSNE